MVKNEEEKKLIPFEKLALQYSTEKTDPIFIEQTRLRGGVFSTVEIGYVIFRLNQRFPIWDFEIIDDKQVDGQIVVKGKLTVKGKYNDELITMTKTQYGSSEVKKFSATIKVWEDGRQVEKPNPKAGEIVDLANDYKAAASDCIKKCASLLGIAFDIYNPNVYNKILTLIAQKQKEITDEPFKIETRQDQKAKEPLSKGGKIMKKAIDNWTGEGDEDPLSPPGY